MTNIPIQRTVVFPGGLDGDDRDPANPSSVEVWYGSYGVGQPAVPRYPNAMGSQTSGLYLPGPAALSDNLDSTYIRVSSAWAADWVAVLDGSLMAEATSITITADVTVTYTDPQDNEPWADVQLDIFDKTGEAQIYTGYLTAYAVAKFRCNQGVKTTIVWTINDAWLSGTHGDDGNMADFNQGYHWYDTDTVYPTGQTGPHAFAAFRDRLLAAPTSMVGVYIRQSAGGFPYEINVSRLVVSIPNKMRTGPVDARRNFFSGRH